MINVIPAAELIQDVVQRALGEDAKASPSFLPQSLLLRWLSEGYQEIVRRTKILTSEMTANLLTSAVHPAPTDILDRLVWHDEAMRVKVGEDWHTLRERDWRYVRNIYGDLTALDGVDVPACWAWDERASDLQILILPPALAAVTNGLKLDYVRDPGALSRLYDPDTATCAVTNGDATVTFAASIEGLVEEDDVFGVKADADSLPTRWYRLDEVTDTLHVELSEVYAGVTNGTALFTLSQVSPVEWKRPNLVKFAPSEYALARYFQREEGESAAGLYRQAFQLELARIVRAMGERPGLALQRADATKRFPGLRRLV